MNLLKNIVSACILSAPFLIYNGCASLNSNKSEGFVEIYGRYVDRGCEVRSRFDDFFHDRDSFDDHHSNRHVNQRCGVENRFNDFSDGHHSDEQNALGLGLAAGVNFPLTKGKDRRILLGPEFRFESAFGDKSVYDFRVGLRGTIDLGVIPLILGIGGQLEWIPESYERDHHETHIQYGDFNYSFDDDRRKEYGFGPYVRVGLGIPLSKDKKVYLLPAFTYSSSEFENDHETNIRYDGFNYQSHRNEDRKYKQIEYSLGLIFHF